LGKQCRECSGDLVLGENIVPSMFKNSDYICRSCHNEAQKIKRQNNIERFRSYDKKASKKWRNNNPVKAKEGFDRMQYSIKPGVYFIYDKDELIYIGQSKIPYHRQRMHFAKHKWATISPVANELYAGNLQRENLRFEMVKFIDDDDMRLQHEAMLIDQYKPRLNTYVLAYTH